MSTLTPPIALEHPANQNRVDYIQDVASQHDFDYPPVSRFSYEMVFNPLLLDGFMSCAYTVKLKL
jgi:hypothetical protein